MPAALSRHWRTAALALPALAALALAWAARPAPLPLPSAAALDALAAFFIAATALGGALAALARPPARFRLRPALALLALLAAYLVTLTPLIPALILLAAALAAPAAPGDAGANSASGAAAAAQPSGRRPALAARLQPLATLLRRASFHAPLVISGAALLLGYGALALRGALRYDDPAAGAALDSFAFWFVLLAAVAQILPLGSAPNRQTPFPHAAIQIAWLYPVARLYSLGPWNDGWALATLLLGAGAALWCAVAAVGRDDPAGRHALATRGLRALALAGLGLGTGAGLAAGCYAILAALALAPAAPREAPAEQQGGAPPDLLAAAGWLLGGAVPFSAPFVAAWMFLGAAVAGGAPLAAAAAWLAALLAAASAALRPPDIAPRPLLAAAAASLALGVLAPAVSWLLILPVIEQLQGGLTVFGDIEIWPWVGLAALDSSRRAVAALPSVAVAALMVVLSAAALLLAHARGAATPDGRGPSDPPAPGGQAPGLLDELRDAVPWLGGARRTAPPSQEPPDDPR